MNQEQTHVDVAPSRPLIVCINNTTNQEQRVKVLFHNAKKEDNYGNPKGVVLTSIPLSEETTAESAYEDMLLKLNNTHYTIGSIFAMATTNSQSVSIPIIVHTDDYRKGHYYGARIIFLKDPYQNQTDVIVNNVPFSLKNLPSIATFVVVCLLVASL